MGLIRNEERRMMAISEGLSSSFDVEIALRRGFEGILKLVGADYGAVALAGPERGAPLRWPTPLQVDLPPIFLSTYQEMSEHDFLRDAAIKQPNIVLRDHQMIHRRGFQQNPFVIRAREIGAPIEQVMSLLIVVEGVGLCGLALYRDRQRPFSADAQRMLQRLTPTLKNTVERCWQYGELSRQRSLIETVLKKRHHAIVIVPPSNREIELTPAATELLDAWFEPVERRGGALPQPLLDALKKAMATEEKGLPPKPWTVKGKTADLKVRFSRHSELRGNPSWAIELQEELHLPASWRERLTDRQAQVAEKLVLGWESRLIAEELGCRTRTVETHVQSILDALGMPDRRALMLHAKDTD
ncbi:Transcriptional regulator, LuxR family protein [Minicystis rosea]|nr:Transcriptional regulator, LuxR family protein [Minicystis rosea]